MNLIDHDQIRNSDESLHYRVLGRATGAGQTMAAQDPKAAIQLIEQFEAPEARSAGFRSVSNIWFRHDEQATIDWLRSLTPEDREAAVKYSSSMREALAR